MKFIWHSGWDCHILAVRSSYNFDLTSGLADPCKIVNCSTSQTNYTLLRLSHIHSVVMQIDTSAPPRCLFAQPPRVCVITSVVCSLSITNLTVYIHDTLLSLCYEGVDGDLLCS